uniref:Uncharacterized protein n=1 Tax=Glossina austeni TaxID=7395 RepID=A0A1A9V8K1_GLOAU
MPGVLLIEAVVCSIGSDLIAKLNSLNPSIVVNTSGPPLLAATDGRTGKPSNELRPAAAATAAAASSAVAEPGVGIAAEDELTAAAAAADNFKANSKFCFANNGFNKSAGSMDLNCRLSSKLVELLIELSEAVETGGEIDEVLPAPELRGLMVRRFGEGLIDGLLGKDGAQTICSGVMFPPSSKATFSLPASNKDSISTCCSVSRKAEDAGCKRVRCSRAAIGERRSDKSRGAVSL